MNEPTGTEENLIKSASLQLGLQKWVGFGEVKGKSKH